MFLDNEGKLECREKTTQLEKVNISFGISTLFQVSQNVKASWVFNTDMWGSNDLALLFFKSRSQKTQHGSFAEVHLRAKA